MSETGRRVPGTLQFTHADEVETQAAHLSKVILIVERAPMRFETLLGFVLAQHLSVSVFCCLLAYR